MTKQRNFKCINIMVTLGVRSFARKFMVIAIHYIIQRIQSELKLGAAKNEMYPRNSVSGGHGKNIRKLNGHGRTVCVAHIYKIYRF